MTGDRIKCELVYSKLLTAVEDIMLEEFELPKVVLTSGFLPPNMMVLATAQLTKPLKTPMLRLPT